MPTAGPGKPGPVVAVVGDCALDVRVTPAGPIQTAGDVPASVRLGPGGQAANVAVRLARRGVRVRLVAPVADDAPGRFLRESIAAEGVELGGLPAERSSVVVVLVDAAGERSMLSDRASLEVAAVAGALVGTGWVHCSGYALLDDASGDALADVLGGLPAEVRVGVGGGAAPRDLAHAARFARRITAAGVDLLVLDREDAAAVSGVATTDAPGAVQALAQMATLAVVTAGVDGSAAALNGTVVTEPAMAREDSVVDTTGAGDAYTAVLIAELHGRPWPPPATSLRAAMRAASQLGSLVARVGGAQTRVAGERMAGEQAAVGGSP